VTRRERAIVSRALELLHDEGYGGAATPWLESLLDQRETCRHVCPVTGCGLRFRFPGELTDHLYFVHGKEWR
jgi:hypothetical protein